MPRLRRRHAQGEVLITKIDTDRNPASAVHYGIRGIPTLIIVEGGRDATRQVGAVPKASLERIIDNAIRMDA